MSSKAMKVNHREIRDEKMLNGRGNTFEGDMSNETKQRRLFERIMKGRKVKPCGKECHEFGMLIAGMLNHSSFQNFTELMNDADFLIRAARITPNPVDCVNYMYFWINNYLKKSTSFKLAYLKSIYLNENVYKLEDIKLIVTNLGLEHENKILLADEEFMLEFKKRLESVDYQSLIEYHCSGEDAQELHDYKVQANNYKVLCENVKKGLLEILKTFKCYVATEEEQSETTEETKAEKRALTYEEQEAEFWANFNPTIRRSYN